MLANTELTSGTLNEEQVCQWEFLLFQLSQAKAGKLNPHVHVEYEWNLRQEEIDESDDDLDDKVNMKSWCSLPNWKWVETPHTH